MTLISSVNTDFSELPDENGSDYIPEESKCKIVKCFQVTQIWQNYSTPALFVLSPCQPGRGRTRISKREGSPILCASIARQYLITLISTPQVQTNYISENCKSLKIGSKHNNWSPLSNQHAKSQHSLVLPKGGNMNSENF